MPDNEFRAVEERFVTLYETAKKCLIVLDGLYSDIEENVHSLSHGESIRSTDPVIMRLYASSFGFVDFSHRFLQIIDAMPLLSKKRPEVKLLYDKTKGIGQCRNYLQHMRNHLSKQAQIDYPILGSIGWIDGQRNYILVPSQTSKNYSNPGIAYDTYSRQYVCKYQLSVGGHCLPIDTVYTDIKSFWTWLESVSHITPEEVKTYQWGKPTILYSELSES